MRTLARSPISFYLGVIFLSIWMSCTQLVRVAAMQTEPTRTGGSVRAVPGSVKSQLGPYFALVIGNNNYKHLSRLSTPIADAEAISEVLRDDYGFEVRLITDAKREDITGALAEYRKGLDESSNLLIYYAGHGYYDSEGGEAYWLPVDASPHDKGKWVSADDVATSIKVIHSRHILIISDSCYAGKMNRDAGFDLTKTERTKTGRSRILEKMAKRKSRMFLASGGDEPVDDGHGHSVFARTLLRALKEIHFDVFTEYEAFANVRESVAEQSDQVPRYDSIPNSGHEGGGFVFIRKSLAAVQPLPNQQSADPATLSPTGASPGPIEADSTELEIVSYDASRTLVSHPYILYPGGFGPSSRSDGIEVRRAIEQATLFWASVRMLKFRSRQEKNDKGVTVWRHDIEATLLDGKIMDVQMIDDWSMGYMGGGGTGLLFGHGDLGEIRIPFSSISSLKVIKYEKTGSKN